MPIQAVIFDLDGTLVDTEAAASRASREVFARLGYTLTDADAHAITGRTWDVAVEHLAARYPLTLSARELKEALLVAYRARLETEIKLIPGARASVRAMARSPLRVALVSGSERSEIAYALERLGVAHDIPLVLGAEDYPRSKPAPDGYARALAELGVDARETLIFEDSSAGIASARAVGAWVVAITCANHDGQDQTRAHESVATLEGVDAHWVARFGLRVGA